MHTTQTVKSSLPQLPPSAQTDTMVVIHFCFKTSSWHWICLYTIHLQTEVRNTEFLYLTYRKFGIQSIHIILFCSICMAIKQNKNCTHQIKNQIYLFSQVHSFGYAANTRHQYTSTIFKY